MINKQLLNPQSIAVIGASNDIHKPGGKVLYNIIKGNYKGELFAVNPKEDVIQNLKSNKDVNDLPDTDLAILAIPAKFCPQTVKILAENKNTRAFIILSAGFSETSEEGAKIEQEVVDIVNSVNGVLIGPNGIGVLNSVYSGVFTSPIPKLDPQGVDFISGSGATAVFIMELGIPNGISFANVYSVGNSAQTGVEEILEYMDESFDENSPKVKLLYIEQIAKPAKLLKHARSLIKKGCRIAAVKSGSSQAGSRAASSHTGALAGSDVAVDALFQKAGIVRCYSRKDLIDVASVFSYPELKGENIGVVTHAGGPAVMLTDALEKGGLNVPQIKSKYKNELLEKLFPGSSVENPIDFLATGTAEQLGEVIDYCENKFDEIDAMVVIFGTPGLAEVFDAYDVIHEKMKTCRKPIFPVLPSINVAKEEIEHFLAKGRVFFPEEVSLANALSKVFFTNKPFDEVNEFPKIDKKTIREVIEKENDGYIKPESIQKLLDAVGIDRAKEAVAYNEEEAVKLAKEISYPLVLKVVGPVHKSDVGGVVLNVKNEEHLRSEFKRLMQIKDTTAVLIQPFLSGTELFVGANYDDYFGHTILLGLGGIYIEVFKDFSAALSPVCINEADLMIKSLKSYKIIEGVRGEKGVNQKLLAELPYKLSALLEAAPEIKELDLNPVMCTHEKIVAADARIKIVKKT